MRPSPRLLAPQGPIKAAELRDFKEKHTEQLHRCRIHLDGKLVDLADISDDHARQVKTAEIMQEIQDDVATLQERMNKRKWPKVLLVGVGGVVGAGLSVAGAVVTGGTVLAVGLAVGGGVISAGGAAHKAVDLVKTPRYDRRTPLAYAALAARL
jgi:hypothetical protein